MSLFADWKKRARLLKREAYALYLACRDPRMPWPVRLLALAVVGYVFSPIDLIPDWIPVIGYLDDMLVVPLGIALVIKYTPPELLAEFREKAQELDEKPINWIAACIIIAIWLLGLALIAYYW